jgi:hypothetical protein
MTHQEKLDLKREGKHKVITGEHAGGAAGQPRSRTRWTARRHPRLSESDNS